MSGVRSVLNIASQALFGSRPAIENKDNAIAGAKTETTSRSAARLEQKYFIEYTPGLLGSEAQADEVARHFDLFIEEQYLDQATLESRYGALRKNLQKVPALLSTDASGTDQVQALMRRFFTDWQELSQNPGDAGLRERLTNDTQSLTALLRRVDGNLADLQEEAANTVKEAVPTVNRILHEIAAVNSRIAASGAGGRESLGRLLDERDNLVREIAEYVDVDAGDAGTGADWPLTTKAGHVLVRGGDVFEFSYEEPQAWSAAGNSPDFDGTVAFTGDSSFEFNVHVVSGGPVNAASNASGTALFRVSPDGGQTWLKDAAGNMRLFAARPASEKITIQGVNVWFESAGGKLRENDTFTIMPKNGLYHQTSAAQKENLTPLIRSDGSDDTTRLTGGAIGGNLGFISGYAGKYRDKLNAVAEAMVWAVNRVHSQDAGEVACQHAAGAYAVRSPNIPLGDAASGLHWNDKLVPGELQISVFGADSPDFSDSLVSGSLELDPAGHSLNDLADALNTRFGGYLTADVAENTLQLTAEPGYALRFGPDSTGVLAGLGINTFFSGTGSADIDLSDAIAADGNAINTSSAAALGALSTADVPVQGAFDPAASRPLPAYQAATRAIIDEDTAGADFLHNYHKALSEDLDERQQNVAGTDLDTEMTDLIRNQNSYQSAAKLITTADEMIRSVLRVRQ